MDLLVGAKRTQTIEHRDLAILQQHDHTASKFVDHFLLACQRDAPVNRLGLDNDSELSSMLDGSND